MANGSAFKEQRTRLGCTNQDIVELVKKKDKENKVPVFGISWLEKVSAGKFPVRTNWLFSLSQVINIEFDALVKRASGRNC